MITRYCCVFSGHATPDSDALFLLGVNIMLVIHLNEILSE